MSAPVFGVYPAPYPVVTDWTRYALDLLPDIAAEPPGGRLFERWTEPLRQIEDRVALLHAGLLEIRDAAGPVLDYLGANLNEPRGGLADDEYRRIVAGRRVARYGAGDYTSIMAAWLALTGVDEENAFLEAPGAGTCTVYLRARIDYTPSDVWLARAGAVAKTFVCGGYYLGAYLHQSDTAFFDDPVHGWTTGRWAYQLRIGA